MEKVTNVTGQDVEKLELQLRAAKRLLVLREGHDRLLDYMRLTMPDPNAADDPTATLFQTTPQAKLLCEVIEKVERGELFRVAVSISPQTGKSQVLTRGGPAWISGRDPRRHIMVGAYNQDFANEFGDDVRQLVTSPFHQQVFPGYELDQGAKDLLITKQRGKMAFVGVGASGTGKPADFFFVDDPIRNDEDANSALFRDRVWKWFNRVVFTRCHGKTPIVVVHCLTGDTLVTMADGNEKRLDAIAPGDRVLSWAGAGTVGSKVSAVVESGIDQTYLIKTSGTEVRANGRHPFLVKSKEGLRWVRTRDLRRGMRIAAQNGARTREWVVRSPVAPRPQNAEACARTTIAARSGRLGRSPRLQLRRYDWRSVVNGATELMRNLLIACSPSRGAFALFAGPTVVWGSPSIGSRIWSPTTTIRRENCAVSYATIATESPDELEIPRSWNGPSNTSGLDTDTVESVEPFGRERVYDLTVEGTHNFLANGLWTSNTRWHEDDLIGRLCDPDHPARRRPVSDGGYAGVEKNWTYFNIPAVVEDEKLASALGLKLTVQTDPVVVAEFGTKPIASLWPEKFPLTFLAEAKHNDPVGFSALRMGKPTPDDGSYFRIEDIVEYDAHELPKKLRKYGASDHAVSKKQNRDYTVIGCVGVDEEDDIWVMPDLVWDRMETDRTVEEMLVQFKLHKPQLWWMESELISKSFGPFLRKRMQEERVYTAVDAVTPSQDKQLRARAMQGRMRMRKVRFPKFAPWWPNAKAQLLRFPAGANDDFVDWLAHIGMGLTKEIAPRAYKPPEKQHRTGSIHWILDNAAKRAREGDRRKAVRGW